MGNDYQPNAAGSTLTTIRKAFYQNATHRICLQILTSLYKTKKREQASEIAHTCTHKKCVLTVCVLCSKTAEWKLQKDTTVLREKTLF